MSLTVLASVSLLALVVNARPVAPDNHDTDATFSDNYARPADLRTAVQAVFESRTKDLASDIDLSAQPTDGLEIHFISPERQQSYLASLDSNAIKALLPLGQPEEGGEMSEDEKRLRQILLDAAAAAKGTTNLDENQEKMDDVDGAGSSVTPSVSEDVLITTEPDADKDLDSAPEVNDDSSLVDDTSNVTQQDEAEVSTAEPSSPFNDPDVTTFVASSALALLVVACVGTALYAVSYARGLIRSDSTWEAVRSTSQGRRGRIALPDDDEEERSGSSGNVVEKVVLNEKDVEKGPIVVLLPDNEKTEVDVETASSVDDDADYMDALDTTPTPNYPALTPTIPSPALSPLPRWSELARQDSHAELRRQASLSNLNLSLKRTSTPPSSLSRGTSKALLRELAAVAAEAQPAVAVPEAPFVSPMPSSTTETVSTTRANPPSTSEPPRYQLDLHAARQGQNPQPRDRQVLDFALAMQLGPGGLNGSGVLGALARVGADPSWVLNVVLALFGWVAVVISGQGTRNNIRRRDRRDMMIAH